MALLRRPRTPEIEPPPHRAFATGNGPVDARPAPDGGPAWHGPLESVLRHPALVVLPAIALVLLALAIGLLRSPVYTSEARINVGRVDVPAYTLQGVTVGNVTLASSYARAIAAPAVIRGAARDAKIPVEEARDNLEASPVPSSTLIRVEAEGDSRREAQRLANAAAARLIDYVTELNVRQQEARSLGRFRNAAERVGRARQRLVRVQRRRGVNSRAADRARLDLQTAQLAARSVGNRVFQASIVPPPENLLQLVVPAATADSDKGSVLRELLLIGLVAGLVVGIALALLRTNWHVLRRVRR